MKSVLAARRTGLPARAPKLEAAPERFGGAAYRPPRAGTQVGSRAGKLKTDWTKPLPLAVELWALNASGSLIDAVSGHSGRPSTRGTGWLGAIHRRYQSLERLA